MIRIATQIGDLCGGGESPHHASLGKLLASHLTRDGGASSFHALSPFDFPALSPRCFIILISESLMFVVLIGLFGELTRLLLCFSSLYEYQ